MRYLFLLTLAAAVTAGCGSGPPGEASAPELVDTARAAPPVAESFGDYWYQGKAEISSYHLEQARYGEIHKGDAVLIFVTEDFSKSKQVKLDNPEAAGEDAVKVLKLNATRDFTTGIYPYTLMTSVFTPLERERFPRPLKITMSAQEWCGQAFVQLNLKDKGYRVQQYSYFESEGDVIRDLEPVITEDELWTTIRLAPEDLPSGNVRIIPGAVFQRLKHTPWQVETAETRLEADTEQPGIMIYTLRYPGQNRTLKIRYHEAFPHEIDSWEETYRDGFGSRARDLTTKARLNRRIMTDYWTRNHVADLTWRKELGLP